MTVKLKVYPDERPKTRGECADMPRPCPFLSCRYHLAHDWVRPVHGEGLTNDEAADRIANAEHTCTLDVADLGGRSARDVAKAVGKTHQGVLSTEARIRNRGIDPEVARELIEAIESQARAPFDLYAPGAVVTEKYWKSKRRRESSESL